LVPTPGIITSGRASTPGRLEDRPHLHLVDFGEHDSKAADPQAQHRVLLVKLSDSAQQRFFFAILGRLLAEGKAQLGRFDQEVFKRGQKLVQRGIEQPDRNWQTLHRRENSKKILALKGQEPRKRLGAIARLRCENHFVDDRQARGLHEHVLGTAETDALRAELARLGRVLRRVGISPHLHAAQLVGPREKRRQPLRQLGRRWN
jgi:hypothetical protein